MLGLPGVGRQGAAVGQADRAALVEKPADVEAVVEDNVQVASLVLDVDLFEGVVDVADAVGHQPQVAGGAVDQQHVEAGLEGDLGHVDGVDDVARPGRPGPRRQLFQGDFPQHVRFDDADPRRQPPCASASAG